MTASTQPDTEWTRGDRVRHGMWGGGAIIALSDGRAMIKFNDGEIRSVGIQYLKKPWPLPYPVANDNAPTEPEASPPPRQTALAPQATPTRTIEVITPSEWHGLPVPEREWYVDDLIPMRQVTIVYGDGGTGKSLWALQIGAAGAMGIQTLGLAPEAGRTFYLGAEDEADEFHRRLIDITHAHGKHLKDLSDFRLAPLAGMDALLSVPDRSGNMHPTPLWTATADYVRDFKPNLVVLDTVADLFGGDEIKRGQARQFIGMLKGLAIEVNCAVILLAHPSVDGMRTGTGSSGSTGWSNSARSRLYLTRPEGKEADPDLRILKTMKINYGKVGNELKMKWHEGVFVLDDGRPNMGAQMLNSKAERVFRDLLSAINRGGERVAKTKGTNYAPKIMAERPDAEGMSVALLEGAMQRLFVAGDIRLTNEGPPSKRRQKLVLASEDFGPRD